MKKEDLVIGKHYVEDREGCIGLYSHGNDEGIFMDREGNFNYLSSYSDDLKIKSEFRQFDIMKVGVYNKGIVWIWERKGFTKKDLENKMIVVTRDETRYIIVDNVALGLEDWVSLDDWDDDLTGRL